MIARIIKKVKEFVGKIGIVVHPLTLYFEKHSNVLSFD